MALIKKELTEKSGFVLEFSVDKATYDKAEYEAYKKNIGKLNIPGFRRGKAPKNIVEKFYGKGVFFEDAINACIPDAFEAAVKEAGLDVVGTPKFDLVSDDGDIVLKAEGFVKPEVTIEGYKGIEVAKTVAEVTDAEIDAEVDAARQRNARSIEINDRAAALGDIANIDYEGKVDGVAFAGGSAKGHDLKLGSGSFIPGFEDQIVGKKIGDHFDVTVTFPEDYHAKDLAGKEAVFACALNAIHYEELPAADDEFAKDVSEFDTLAEYKADIKAKLVKRNEDRAEGEFENAIAEALMSKLVAEIPEPMFVAETENYVRDYDSRLRSQGLDLATYFKYTGMTLDALRTQMRPQAEKQVKVRLALEKIASLEKITVADEDVEAEYKRISDAYNVPVDQVKGMVAAEDISADLVVGKAMELVKANAVITGAKKPAKKTAAKKAAASDAEAAPKAKKAAAADAKAAPKAKKAAAADADAAPKAKKTTKAASKKDAE